MTNSFISGIVFANTNDASLKKITANRSMASVPFGARYRLIDFSLSNLANAGVTDVGIITKENYRSLMDHISNGASWELDRKNGGLYLLPPYRTSSARRYSGTAEALLGSSDYLDKLKSEYTVLYNSDVIANVDILAAVEYHIAQNADITLVYADGKEAESGRDNIFLEVSASGKVTKLTDDGDTAKKIFTGIAIVATKLLKKITVECAEEDLADIYTDFIAAKISKFKVCGYLHTGYLKFMGSINSYYDANMDILKGDVRQNLFNRNRPIFTKSRDDMPTRYGTKAKVSNSIVADGCVIDGTVKNSILFRGVKVEKGAVVENSILIQGTAVCKDARLFNVIADKNAVIGEGMVLKGSKDKHFYVKRNQIV